MSSESPAKASKPASPTKESADADSKAESRAEPRAESRVNLPNSTLEVAAGRLSSVSVIVVESICRQLVLLELSRGRASVALQILEFIAAVHDAAGFSPTAQVECPSDYPGEYMTAAVQTEIVKFASFCHHSHAKSEVTLAIDADSRDIHLNDTTNAFQSIMSVMLNEDPKGLTQNFKPIKISSSKLFSDVLIHLESAIIYMSQGLFSGAFTFLGRSIGPCIQFDEKGDLIKGSSFKHYIIYLMSWSFLLAGNTSRACTVLKGVTAMSRMSKQFDLCVRVTELAMLMRVLRCHYGFPAMSLELDNMLLKVKIIRRRDENTSCCNAILALAHVLRSNYAIAIPMSRLAVAKLAQKEAVTPISSIFIFIAGYAAAVIVERFPRSALDHELSPRFCTRALEVANSAISALKKNSVYLPFVSVLCKALECKVFSLTNRLRDITVVSNFFQSLRAPPFFSEFVFGNAFLELETANLLSKLDISIPRGNRVLGNIDDAADSACLLFSKLECPESTFSSFCGPGLNACYFALKI